MTEIELKDFKFDTAEYVTAPKGAPYLTRPDKIEQLQVKLDKVVGALTEIYKRDDKTSGELRRIAQQTLLEIKGGA